METIEEKAIEYADRLFEERLGNCGAKSGYIAGYSEAMRWRDVKDEYPPLGELVLVRGNLTYTDWDTMERKTDVLHQAAIYDKTSEKGHVSGKVWYGEKKVGVIGIIVTHWRLIE